MRGAAGVSTAADYMNFVSMLLNGGVLNGQRILSPMTVALMASDQLGNRTTLPLPPGQLLMGVDGYTFGLGFMVRQGGGLASVPGSAGEYLWAGAGGTFFWIDPKEQLAVVLMAQAPGPIRTQYRRTHQRYGIGGGGRRVIQYHCAGRRAWAADPVISTTDRRASRAAPHQ